MSSPLLGLDIGTRRTGVALSPNGVDVQDLATIAWEPPHAHKLIAAISDLVREHQVETVVVGTPLSAEGADTSQSLRHARLQALLSRELTSTFPSLKVVEVNEFSSTIDGKAAFPHLDRDAAAACAILSAYLEHHA